LISPKIYRAGEPACRQAGFPLHLFESEDSSGSERPPPFRPPHCVPRSLGEVGEATLSDWTISRLRFQLRTGRQVFPCLPAGRFGGKFSSGL